MLELAQCVRAAPNLPKCLFTNANECSDACAASSFGGQVSMPQ